MKDLDFVKIFEESDERSRNLYFHGAYFAFVDGVIKVTGIGDDCLSTYYWTNSPRHRLVRERRVIPYQNLELFRTIDLGCGIYYADQHDNVTFISKPPQRSASKGLRLGELSGHGGYFEDDNELIQFLIEVVKGERVPNYKYTYTQDGREYTMLYGEYVRQQETEDDLISFSQDEWEADLEAEMELESEEPTPVTGEPIFTIDEDTPTIPSPPSDEVARNIFLRPRAMGSRIDWAAAANTVHAITSNQQPTIVSISPTQEEVVRDFWENVSEMEVTH